MAEEQQELETRAYDDDDGTLQEVTESLEVQQLRHKLHELTLESNELRDTVS